jgi:NAD-dependent SIR2 family protein deacetylase
MDIATVIDSRKNRHELSNGFKISIERGIAAMRNFRLGISYGNGNNMDNIEKLAAEIKAADAIIIGAGAGMSTAAGFIYNGPRFEKYFFDFQKRYGINEMYSGGFYPYPSKEIFWAYWSRYIYVNRYMDPPKKTYNKLYELVKDKDYFVITTNVDHCFQKAGFDKKRLFYTQGDYGLFQSVNPDIKKTFDNEKWVVKAMESQGFIRNNDGIFDIPEDKYIKMEIPTDLIPKCPDDGSDMTTNLRADNNFVEDKGWHRASGAYADFLRRHENLRVLYLELGVGSNTPVIIKYPFWQMTAASEKATYACINYGESYCPKEIDDRSICIDEDIDKALDELRSKCEL